MKDDERIEEFIEHLERCADVIRKNLRLKLIIVPKVLTIHGMDLQTYEMVRDDQNNNEIFCQTSRLN